MPTCTRALLIGVNHAPATACETDVQRWRSILTQPAPAPALPPGRVVVLTGGAASRTAVLGALRALADGVVTDRLTRADAYGFFCFSGIGCRLGPDTSSGICLADSDVAFDELVEVLDLAFPDLAAARRAGGGTNAAILTDLPTPGLLAVLDTATVDGPVPPGCTSRARPGSPRGVAGRMDLDPERNQPRLRYHARQIAPQGVCYSWEGEESGMRQGEITRWFAPWFADHHDEIAIFGQEIGAGTSGLTIHGIEYPGGNRLGTTLWTNAREPVVNGITLRPRRALWHVDGLPAEFMLVPLAVVPAAWPGPQRWLDAENVPFPGARQGSGLPAASVVYQLRARPSGLPLGYMGLVGPADAPTGQWWAAPFGVIDNHGFFVHAGPIQFRVMAQPPTLPDNWRLVTTL